MDAKKQASFQTARAARGRKRKHAKERNEVLCNNLSLPKRRRDDKSFADDFRRIVDFHLMIRDLKNGCYYCRQRPLLLSEGILQDQRSQSPDKIQIMCRSCKRLSHISINNSSEINEKLVLACLHTGTGNSYLDSYLNIVGLRSISKQKFKGMERKGVKEIEQVAGESWKKWKEAELEKEKLDRSKENWKDLLMNRGGNSGDTILSFDMELSLAIVQKVYWLLITELRTLIAEHASNQCEWVTKQIYKRRRKSLKEIRKRTTKIKESVEGTTYESGVDADQAAKKIMEIIDHPSPDVYEAVEWMKEKFPRYRNDKLSSTDGKCKDRDIRPAFYDLETGEFRKDADLLQVCFHCDGVDDLDLQVMPEKGIEPSATNSQWAIQLGRKDS